MERPTLYTAFPPPDDKDHPGISYIKILQLGEQLLCSAKQATQSSFVTHEEMERLCQVGDLLQKEVQNVRNELIRRKNLELLLPSPNTQKHLPCSNLLSTVTPSPVASTSPVTQPSVSPEASPPLTAAISEHQEYWGNKKMESRHRTAPMYVNLTEQMILAQSSKRKRPTEGTLFCHNCKTKDTPEWRRGPSGAKTLCNACGIRWRLSQGEVKQHRKGCVNFFEMPDQSTQLINAQGAQLLLSHSITSHPPQHQQILLDLHRHSATNVINDSNNSNGNAVATAVATGVA